MRIIEYSLEKSDDKNILIKENSSNYPELSELNSPQKIVDMFNAVFRAKNKAEEYVWLLALDRKMHPLGVFEVSHGTVDMSVLTPREVLIRLLMCGASQFVMAHNHPSGDTTPSQDDYKVAKRLKEAADIIGISFLDNIIIGQGYFSFEEKELFNNPPLK